MYAIIHLVYVISTTLYPNNRLGSILAKVISPLQSALVLNKDIMTTF